MREGDDISYLSNLIGKSHRLKSLDLWHMPLNDSFRNGLAVNKSIQELSIRRDLGEEGFLCLAPFFLNSNTLKELCIDEFYEFSSISRIASLLSQSQIQSLTRFCLEGIELDDG